MTNYTHFPISGDPPAHLRLSPSPPTTTTATAQQLVPYHPPKKKKRTKLVRVDTPAGTTFGDGGMPGPSFLGVKPFRVGTGSGSGGALARPRKPDPSAPKITRPCTECGKKFWSWKALFGHMRCHPERQWRGINPPANLRPQEATFHDRVAEMTEEEHEVAACLLLLANGPGPAHPEVEKEGVVIIVNPNITSINPDYELITNSGDSFRFECSSCKKVFGSHQALGGHRASHKNVKGCFAIHRTGGGDVAEGSGDMAEGGGDVAEMVAGLGHKCDVCFRVFSSGQALGGHKRCHFEKGGLNCFDLNLPAPIEDYNDFNDSVSCFSSGLALDLRLGI